MRAQRAGTILAKRGIVVRYRATALRNTTACLLAARLASIPLTICVLRAHCTYAAATTPC